MRVLVAAVFLAGCGANPIDQVKEAVRDELGTKAIVFTNVRKSSNYVCGDAKARGMDYSFQALVDKSGEPSQVIVYSAQRGSTDICTTHGNVIAEKERNASN
jgi:hypothetical protein